MNQFITIDANQFKSITIEECLNYVPDEKLEGIIKSYVSNVLKILNDKKNVSLTKDDMITFFLQQILLKISANNIWITSRNKSKLDQKYLYTVIKKYLFLIDPNFFN